jgi:hypothetical protein
MSALDFLEGERNVKVEKFVDLGVAAWEASRAIGINVRISAHLPDSQPTAQIMWWATCLTFNFHRIIWHMTGLLGLGRHRTCKADIAFICLQGISGWHWYGYNDRNSKRSFKVRGCYAESLKRKRDWTGLWKRRTLADRKGEIKAGWK